MKPSAKRALSFGLRGLNANAYWRVAGILGRRPAPALRSERAAWGPLLALRGTGAGTEPGERREPGGCGSWR